VEKCHEGTESGKHEIAVEQQWNNSGTAVNSLVGTLYPSNRLVSLNFSRCFLCVLSVLYSWKKSTAADGWRRRRNTNAKWPCGRRGCFKKTKKLEAENCPGCGKRKQGCGHCWNRDRPSTGTVWNGSNKLKPPENGGKQHACTKRNSTRTPTPNGCGWWRRTEKTRWVSCLLVGYLGS
jgi:hypothetical protein